MEVVKHSLPMQIITREIKLINKMPMIKGAMTENDNHMIIKLVFWDHENIKSNQLDDENLKGLEEYLFDTSHYYRVYIFAPPRGNGMLNLKETDRLQTLNPIVEEHEPNGKKELMDKIITGISCFMVGVFFNHKVEINFISHDGDYNEILKFLLKYDVEVNVMYTAINLLSNKFRVNGFNLIDLKSFNSNLCMTKNFIDYDQNLTEDDLSVNSNFDINSVGTDKTLLDSNNEDISLSISVQTNKHMNSSNKSNMIERECTGKVGRAIDLNNSTIKNIDLTEFSTQKLIMKQLNNLNIEYAVGDYLPMDLVVSQINKRKQVTQFVSEIKWCLHTNRKLNPQLNQLNNQNYKHLRINIDELCDNNNLPIILEGQSNNLPASLIHSTNMLKLSSDGNNTKFEALEEVYSTSNTISFSKTKFISVKDYITRKASFKPTLFEHK